MQINDFKEFLELYPKNSPQFKEITISDYISNCVQAEEDYSDLELAFKNDKGKSLLKTITVATGKDSFIVQSVSYYFDFCTYLILKSRQISESEKIILEANINKIENSTNLSNDQKLLLIKDCYNQVPFKTKLLGHWCGCSISGSINPKMLIVTLIKPFEECDEVEKFDVNNSLLLTPNYSKLFEEYLITFDILGKIMISDTLNDNDLLKLMVSKKDRLRGDKLTMNHAYYLEEHRQRFLEFRLSTVK